MGDELPVPEEYLLEQLEEIFDMKVGDMMNIAYRAAQLACSRYDVPGQAEDIAQEAFILLIRALPGIRSRGRIAAPSSYIWKCVTHATINWARKKDRPGRWGDRSPSTSDNIPEGEAPTLTAVSEATRAELLGNFISQELLTLPEHLRRSALTTWNPETLNFDRVTSSEASQILDIPPGTIRGHISLAKKEIRKRHPELANLLRDLLDE
jgi:RNA polymerase sigma factor (sigma-70 family)